LKINHIPLSFVLDVCPINLLWNQFEDYNALQEDWPKWVFIKHPFSITTTFVVKCAIEYLKGSNILILCPYDSLISNS
jgi:hypothetical protein